MSKREKKEVKGVKENAKQTCPRKKSDSAHGKEDGFEKAGVR